MKDELVKQICYGVYTITIANVPNPPPPHTLTRTHACMYEIYTSKYCETYIMKFRVPTLFY